MILTLADVPVLRQRLGEDYADMSDEDLLAEVLVVPVEASILATYPDIPQGDENVRLAAVLLLAAAIVETTPQVTSEKLGNTTITYAAGDATRLAGEWERRAWDLLATVAGVTPALQGFLFGRIRMTR